MTRDAFLARVRAALAAGRAAHGGHAREQGGPGPLERAEPVRVGVAGLPRADHPGPDPAAWPERFGRELEAAGGSSARVAADATAVADHVEAYARRHGLRHAVTWDPGALPAQEAGWLRAAWAGLERAGCRVQALRAAAEPGATPGGGDPARAAAAAADAGLVVADAAVVASGTVLLVHGPGRSRMASLLPEHLLVLVPEHRLRPTLAEVLAELAAALRAGAPVQNATLVTGPSKSADIELELVTGVHGPRWVHAVVVAARAAAGDGAQPGGLSAPACPGPPGGEPATR